MLDQMVDEDADGVQHIVPFPNKDVEAVNSPTPYLRARYAGRITGSHPFSVDVLRLPPVSANIKELHCIWVLAGGIGDGKLGELWDSIALTDLEADVVSGLRIIAPDVERLGLVADKNPYVQRSPIVKIAGLDGPIPLRSMGEGMNRMFGLVLALVNAKDGMLLIDEVDTGIHYSVLPDMWRLIFEVAHRLNVQVFATSHSWDCIQAFQAAADENKEEEGMLIRLENRDGAVASVLFDERKLNIATREHIEVR